MDVKIIFYFYLCLLPLISVFSKERNCTISGHICNSSVKDNVNPCENYVYNKQVCQRRSFAREFCDYCPELHEAIPSGPTFRVNETACRQEDGFYKCQFGGPKVNCVRRTWIRETNSCQSNNDTILVQLNCTDDEMTCKVQGRCVKRYDINSESRCQTEPRKYYIRCHEDEFECKISNKCLPRDWVRDGSVDCSIYGEVNDTSDEDQPLSSCNNKTEFRCQDRNARCIPIEMVMDGRSNCPDSSDENQTLSCHNETDFKCQFNGRCVRRYRVNDGFPDCPNGTDENVSNFQCKNRTEFDCGDGRCIPRSWVGNSLIDCKSAIDEIEVDLKGCFDNEFMCDNGSRCLPLKYQCDGIKNCNDCSDEVESCDEPLMFRCNDDPSVCIPWTNTCDNTNDCNDNSDEETHKLQGYKCKSNGKTCHVPQFLLSTKIDMCPRHSASPHVCYDVHGEFLCAKCLTDGIIIAKTQVCDGIFDCRDLSDECPCEKSDATVVCDEIFSPSSDGGSLTNLTIIREKIDSICNGTDEWKNKEDELFCFAKSTTAQNNIFSDSVIPAYNYDCIKFSENMYKTAEDFGILPYIEIFIKSKATKCNGAIECVMFDDECSDECANQPGFCKDIPISNKRWPVFGEQLNIRACPDPKAITEAIAPAWICDGLQNCDNGEDERNCSNRFYCNAGEGSTLITGKRPIVSIKMQQICDLNSDCIDSSDEMNCGEDTHFYCKGKSPLFIERKKYLDGEADCRDYSDECPIELFKKNAFSSKAELIGNIILRVFIWIVAIATSIGNLWVIITTIKKLKKSPDKSSNAYTNRMLIVNLAVADLLTGICLWILIVKSVQFSGKYCLHDNQWRVSATCNMIGVLFVISSQTSLNVIVVLTGQRLFSAFKPLKSNYVNRKAYIFLTCYCWMAAMFVAFYPILRLNVFSSFFKIQKTLFFSSNIVKAKTLEKYYKILQAIGDVYGQSSVTKEDSLISPFFQPSGVPEKHIHIDGVYGFYSSNSVCFPDYFSISEQYFSLLMILYNTAGLVFVMISYVIIYKKNTRKTNPCLSTRCKENEKLKKRITMLVIASTCCWLPICLMAFYSFIKPDLPKVVYTVAAVVLLPINSCFNPILYSQVHKKIFNILKVYINKARS